MNELSNNADANNDTKKLIPFERCGVSVVYSSDEEMVAGEDLARDNFSTPKRRPAGKCCAFTAKLSSDKLALWPMWHAIRSSTEKSYRIEAFTTANV